MPIFVVKNFYPIQTYMKNIKNKKNNLDPIAEAGKRKDAKRYSDEADIRINLAIEVYRARKSKKLSQQSLAKKSCTTQKIISNIENGDVNIGIDLLNRLSKTLNFTSEILGKIFNTPILYWCSLQEGGILKMEIKEPIESEIIL